MFVNFPNNVVITFLREKKVDSLCVTQELEVEEHDTYSAFYWILSNINKPRCTTDALAKYRRLVPKLYLELAPESEPPFFFFASFTAFFWALFCAAWFWGNIN